MNNNSLMSGFQLECRVLEHGSDLGLPSYESALAAGADLRAALNLEPFCGCFSLQAGCFAKIPTALQIALPKGYEAQVRPRSGLAAKHGVTILNAPGTIDADYRGEISILLINHGQQDFVIRHGDRIAQLVIAPVVQAAFIRVPELSKTERGPDGFGSSGLS